MKRKTDIEIVEAEDNLEFIKRDYLWPLKIFLPLTRNDKEGNEELGILFFLDKTVIILDNVFFYCMKSNDDKLQTQKLKYDSIESLLADGWIVN